MSFPGPAGLFALDESSENVADPTMLFPFISKDEENWFLSRPVEDASEFLFKVSGDLAGSFEKSIDFWSFSTSGDEAVHDFETSVVLGVSSADRKGSDPFLTFFKNKGNALSFSGNTRGLCSELVDKKFRVLEFSGGDESDDNCSWLSLIEYPPTFVFGCMPKGACSDEVDNDWLFAIEVSSGLSRGAGSLTLFRKAGALSLPGTLLLVEPFKLSGLTTSESYLFELAETDSLSSRLSASVEACPSLETTSELDSE